MLCLGHFRFTSGEVMNQNKKPNKNNGYKYFVKKDISQSNATSPICQSEASPVLANQNTEKQDRDLEEIYQNFCLEHLFGTMLIGLCLFITPSFVLLDRKQPRFGTKLKLICFIIQFHLIHFNSIFEIKYYQNLASELTGYLVIIGHVGLRIRKLFLIEIAQLNHSERFVS